MPGLDTARQQLQQSTLTRRTSRTSTRIRAARREGPRSTRLSASRMVVFDAENGRLSQDAVAVDGICCEHLSRGVERMSALRRLHLTHGLLVSTLSRFRLAPFLSLPVSFHVPEHCCI
jgi:hypothetical protein